MDNSSPMPSLADRLPDLGQVASKRPPRQVPFVAQTSSADCGAACLAMVLALNGKYVRLEDVRETAGIGRDGVDAYTLIQAAHWYGLLGRGVQVEEVTALRFLQKGAILHWGFSHYVVLERMTRKGAVILDPGIGRREISLEELRQEFTGVALLFDPGPDFAAGGRREYGFKRYVSHLREAGSSLSRTLVLSVFLQLLALATPILTGLLVDRVIPRGDRSLLVLIMVGLAGVTIFHFLSSLIRAHLLLQLRTHLDARMTLEFLDHMIDLPYRFFQQRSAGDLMMRLNSNATVREILTSSALSGALDGVLVTLYLALLTLTDLGLGVLVLCLGLAQVSVYLATRRRQKDLMSSELRSQARSRAHQVQMLAGIETLKAMGAERRSVEQWSNLFVDELNVSLARGRLTALSDALLGALRLAAPFLILVYGGLKVLDGDLSLGTMLAASALATGFLAPLSTLVSTGFQLQILGSYTERLRDVLEMPKEQEHIPPSERAPAPRLQGRITLDEVSFRYSRTGPMVVRSVSLDIEPGSFVALVGGSGAGKTTLAHLLAGLYQPTSGRVLFDGLDLAGLALPSVRKQLGVVTQYPHLFGESIRRNLALGDPEIEPARLVEACRRAQLHDEIVAMPMGYDSILAEGGASLSGGQRQRLALARALVRQPAILLLDEATSNLDAITERAIQEELAGLDATRIVIAHRLSTVIAADVILVMDDGEVVERGNHQELLALSGRYRRLIDAQIQRDIEPDRRSEFNLSPASEQKGATP